MQLAENNEYHGNVTGVVKQSINEHLKDNDVTPTYAILKMQYGNGQWLCLSKQDDVDDIAAWNEYKKYVLGDYWRNKATNDDAIWLHRSWVEREFFDG